MDALIYILLALTSVVGLAFIVERGLALRWGKVVPPAVTEALAACRTRADVETLRVALRAKTVGARTFAYTCGGSSRLAQDRQRGRLADRRAP